MVRYFDELTLEDIINVSKDLKQHEKFGDLKYFVVDARDVCPEKIQIFNADIPASIDSTNSTYKPFLKGAMVCTDPHVRLAFQRYIDTSMASGSTWLMEIFDNIDAALRWAKSN